MFEKELLKDGASIPLEDEWKINYLQQM
jgi:hypothetical protein